MTVAEFYEVNESPLKVMSGYNGKILCKRYKGSNEKHVEEIGNREISRVWCEIEASKSTGFGNIGTPIMCCYVIGDVEYAQEKKIQEVTKCIES